MHRKNSPANRWTRGHGEKIVHHWWLGAVWHAVRVTWFRRHSRFVWFPYHCRWGQWYYDGETAPAHWHVGRRPRKR